MFPGQSWTGGSSSPAASESMHHHHHQGYSTLFGKHGTPLAAAVHGGYRVPHFLACWVCRKHILIHQWNVKAWLFSSESRQFFISGCCYSDCGLWGLEICDDMIAKSEWKSSKSWSRNTTAMHHRGRSKKSHVESLLLRSHGTLKKPFYVCNLGGHDGAAVASERDKKEKSAIMTEVFGKKCIIWSQTRKKVSPFVSSQKLKRNLFLGTKVPRELDPIINSSFIIDFMKNWCRKNAGKKCNFVRQK